MNEDRLRALLRDEHLPGSEEAERRGLALVERAYEDRRPPARPALPRLAVALVAATLLAALLLSPAGAAVRDWIGGVFTAGVRDAEPALTEVPGGGRLLVQSPRGPWVVHADGSRRLLGRYDEATWSPRGLFVAAASGRTLSAIEPDGTPHWSVSAKGTVTDPRWSPSGLRIAYRAGRSLHVVHADGTESRRLGPSAPVAPAWLPLGPHQLAYVDTAKRLRVVEADTAQTLATAAASPGVEALSWAADDQALLEVAPRALWLRRARLDKMAASIEVSDAHRLPLPAGAIVRAAAFSPRADTIAALIERDSRKGGPRSEAILLSAAGGPARRVLAIRGQLSQLAWSPDGHRLLLAWPAADQWLFQPVQGRGRLHAVANIASVFSPGHRGRAPFPQIDGWCCAAIPGG